jgi:hypothetical protein
MSVYYLFLIVADLTINYTFKHMIMKKIFILIFALFFTQEIFAQDKLLGILPLREGKVTYSDVVQIQGVSKDEMYKRVKLWFIETYNSSKDVIQLDDKDHGEIIGKGCFRAKWNFRFYTALSMNVWKTIKIQIKNDSLRYEISDFRLNNYFFPTQNASLSDASVPLEAWNKGHDANNKRFYPRINNQMIALINSLEAAIKSKANDNWLSSSK